jgi:hypothetical protein
MCHIHAYFAYPPWRLPGTLFCSQTPPFRWWALSEYLQNECLFLPPPQSRLVVMLATSYLVLEGQMRIYYHTRYSSWTTFWRQGMTIFEVILHSFSFLKKVYKYRIHCKIAVWLTETPKQNSEHRNSWRRKWRPLGIPTPGKNHCSHLCTYLWGFIVSHRFLLGGGEEAEPEETLYWGHWWHNVILWKVVG